MISANFTGIYILIWWLIIQFLGWLALPVAYRLFRWLPDRGYAFSKALGLLMVSYLIWLGSITGFLHNSRGGLLIATLLVAALSAWLYYRSLRPGSDGEPSLRDFLREHKGMIISVELLFAVAFILWAVLRAYASFKIDTAGGEKFMEIAFLNAILRSVHFPPLDPWLSGFSISYYYFGYVMMAVMTRLSGAPAGVAFDLYDALLFALTLVGAFGVVYNLVPAARRVKIERPSFGSGQPIRYALLGALLVAVMGNLSGFVQSVYSTGLVSDSFWNWLNAPNLVARAEKTGTFIPTDTGWFWWWQGSRVVAERDLLGKSDFVNPAITEFPFFSFLLGDNHPHVLALPFALMAIGLGLNLLRRMSLRGRANQSRPGPKQSPISERASPPSADRNVDPSIKSMGGAPWWNPIAYCLDGDAFLFVMTAFGLGALGFLNTWDFPIYLVLATLAYGVGLYASQHAGTTRRLDGQLVRRTLSLGIGLGLVAVLLYILFYLGFSSQAAGILPFIFPPTQLRQYFVMFGPFLVILAVFMGVYLLRSVRHAGRQVLGKTLFAWLATALALLSVYTLMLLGLSLLDLLLHLTRNNPVLNSALSGLSASAALGKALSWRLRDPWLLLLLSGLVTFAVANLVWHVRTASTPSASESDAPEDGSSTEVRASPGLGHGRGSPASPEPSHPRLSPSVLFVFLLVFLGVALTFSVEFVYLRDSFGTRMNTIFKFYYQGWVMMACASAYAVWWLLNRTEKVIGAVGKYIFLALAGLVIVAGMFYPIFAFDNRVEGFKVAMKPNLDGTSALAQRSPDDWAAITWLNENVSGTDVILEAPGHNYDYEGRISALTGLPAVLGWSLHEGQWRGSYTEQGKREPDIATIYTARDDQKTLDLLHKWNVKYVILGEAERGYIRGLCAVPDYACSAASAIGKFDGLLPVVYTGGTMIYAVP